MDRQLSEERERAWREHRREVERFARREGYRGEPRAKAAYDGPEEERRPYWMGARWARA